MSDAVVQAWDAKQGVYVLIRVADGAVLGKDAPKIERGKPTSPFNVPEIEPLTIAAEDEGSDGVGDDPLGDFR